VNSSYINQLHTKLQVILGTFVPKLHQTFEETCYLGPEYIQDVGDDLIDEDITFYYLNKAEGLCKGEEMKTLAKNTGGEFYSYTESGGIDQIILELIDVIKDTYGTGDRINTLNKIPENYENERDLRWECCPVDVSSLSVC